MSTLDVFITVEFAFKIDVSVVLNYSCQVLEYMVTLDVFTLLNWFYDMCYCLLKCFSRWFLFVLGLITTVFIWFLF